MSSDLRVGSEFSVEAQTISAVRLILLSVDDWRDMQEMQVLAQKVAKRVHGKEHGNRDFGPICHR